MRERPKYARHGQSALSPHSRYLLSKLKGWSGSKTMKVISLSKYLGPLYQCLSPCQFPLQAPHRIWRIQLKRDSEEPCRSSWACKTLAEFFVFFLFFIFNSETTKAGLIKVNYMSIKQPPGTVGPYLKLRHSSEKQTLHYVTPGALRAAAVGITCIYAVQETSLAGLWLFNLYYFYQTSQN